VAYDIFGNGKTALKATVGKYVAQEALDLANTFNPLSSQTDARAWTDVDGNRSIFQTGTFNVQRNEIGPTRNNNFGLAAGVPKLDPNLERPYNWSYSLTVQHELMPQLSVSGGYYRRTFHNISRTINQAVDPVADFTPFTIVGPRHPSLPNGGGEVITLYNLNQNRLGAVDQIVTFSDINSRHYDGYEVNMNGRLPYGASVFGGITYGRSVENNCDVAHPNDLRFCELTPPFQGTYKLGWNLSLPFRFAFNGTFQAIPGDPIQANFTVNSAVAGRPITGGGNLPVPGNNNAVRLMDPQSEYLPMVKTFDVRITHSFAPVRRMRARVFVDLLNIANMSTILARSTTFGPNWLVPTAAQTGRYVRLGTQIDF
jgi:hypothetical protein